MPQFFFIKNKVVRKEELKYLICNLGILNFQKKELNTLNFERGG